MNKRQAAALKRILEAADPDAGVTVEPQSDGVHVTISGAKTDLGLAGPDTRDVELRLSDNSPLLLCFLARHETRHAAGQA